MTTCTLVVTKNQIKIKYSWPGLTFEDAWKLAQSIQVESKYPKVIVIMEKRYD